MMFPGIICRRQAKRIILSHYHDVTRNKAQTDPAAQPAAATIFARIADVGYRT